MTDLATEDIERLWTTYKANGSQKARDQLIVHYSPLVKYVAGRVAVGLPQNVDQADLVSYGLFGLIDAIDKFDPRRGFKFETYAIARIKGAILDELRSIDWVPRSVRAKARAIEKAYGKLESQLHRTPSDEELADELEMSSEQLQTTLNQISFIGLVALDEMLSTGDRNDAMTLGEAGVDYLLFGEPRPDGSLPSLESVAERAAWWAEIFETPCVAFAPSLDAIPALVATRAEFIALSDAVWSHEGGPAGAVAAAMERIGTAEGER